jgi:CubicO group peptidase (beta-lactamase class C family)
MSAGSRSLPARPSLRHLKLEAKRRLAAGEFATLHDAQTAVAREHGLPSWARLKQACDEAAAAQDGPALAHLRWVVERFSGAGRPGWAAPGEDELREHFDDRFLAAMPVSVLAEQAGQIGLHGELVVIGQAPLEAQVELPGLRLIAAAEAAPPHRLIGLRGFPLGERVTDPRVKDPPPARTLGDPPEGIAAVAEQSRAELGLPALLLAGGDPGRAPWVVAAGHADLDRSEPVRPGSLFPVPGLTGLVTGTAVLRLAARGRLGLDDPANRHLRAVSLADGTITIRELLGHTAGVGNPEEYSADSVPDLAALMGPVIACDGPHGTVQASNGGYGVLGQLVADVTGRPYAEAAASLVLEPLGMRDSRFPARAADLGADAVTGYTLAADGTFEAFPARVPTVQAIAGLWSTGTDLVRLGTGWPSLVPAALARAALSRSGGPGPRGLHVGLGWILDGETAAYAGVGFEALALLRSRVRDRRSYVVLTSRAVTVDSLDDRLRRAWLKGSPS